MKIKCLNCGNIIESKTTHDFVTCKCESCHVDGGNDYFRFGGEDFDKMLIIFDDGTEVLASNKELYSKKYNEWFNKKFDNAK